MSEFKRCNFSKCTEQGTTHKWGYGFTFCEEHMPLLKKMARTRLKSISLSYPTGRCVECGERKSLKARKMCTNCYNNSTWVQKTA